jgi:hypothetical protein
MTAPVVIGDATLHCGDSREVLKTLAEASVDSIVCDPPYELGFMGKGWDSTGVANDPVLWREALRVLKPGGYLLAFSGTRTYHRMVCAIEDAGFEIRDQLGYLYGSGFPKSLNVGRAVEERLAGGGSAEASVELGDDEALFCAWIRDHSGLTVEQLRAVTGSARFMTGKVEIVNTATVDAPRMGRRAMVPTAAAWDKLKPLMREQPPEWVEALVKEPPQPPSDTAGEEWKQGKGQGTASDGEWAGWGTALKPAWEPIVMARKPRGTVADNVIAYGTGALNIDDCRVRLTDADASQLRTMARGVRAEDGWGMNGDEPEQAVQVVNPSGRWPSNIITDGSDEVLAGFPFTSSGAGAVKRASSASEQGNAGAAFGAESRPAGTPMICHGDSGSAARFFYTAKPSPEDRHEGIRNTATAYGRNIHATVKPTDLMRYLCRLVTPKGGIVLDPFMGSGSTGKAAMLEGFAFVGIDMTPEYVEIARARIDFAKRQGHQPDLLEAA